MAAYGPAEERFHRWFALALRLSLSAAGCACALAVAALALLVLVFALGDRIDGAFPDRLGPAFSVCLLLISFGAGTVVVAAGFLSERDVIGRLLAGLSPTVRRERRESARRYPVAATTELLAAPAPGGNGREPEAAPAAEGTGLEPEASPGAREWAISNIEC